jgi:hypothetical protein
MLKKICLILILIPGIGQILFAQSSGMEFINLAGGSTVYASGGLIISRIDKDPACFLSNPALLGYQQKGSFSFSYNPFLTGISHLNATTIFNTKKTGAIGFSAKMVDYGTIETFDPTGVSSGREKAAAYLISAAKFKTTGNYTFGAAFKFASNQLAGYNQYGIVTDIGGLFKHPEKDLQLGMVIKNLGIAFRNYEGARISLPFDVQVSGTYKPEHMPLRLGMTIQNLVKFNTFPEDEADKKIEGYRPPSALKKIANHVILSTELVLSKNFSGFLSYNLKRRQELRAETASGGAGISFGALFTVKKISFGFSRSLYHIGAGTNCFTVITNINNFLPNKSI